MVDLHKRIEAFASLGAFFREYVNQVNGAPEEGPYQNWIIQLRDVVRRAEQQNGWFTEENILSSIRHWGHLLTEENVQAWLRPYSLEQNQTKTVALIFAGNIPLVGFHDFLSTVITGNKALVKLSSNDQVLMSFIWEYLCDACHDLKGTVVLTQERMTDFDAVIATGSDNTARYFEYYFGKKPHIIRKNRNGVAVLHGKETEAQLRRLGEDIFRYFGLGCRSISKLFVPNDYDFDRLFEALFEFKSIITLQKYANNYDYNKAVFLMSEFKVLENGFLMLKEDPRYSSPIAILFYEYYDSKEALAEKLKEDTAKIQCIVADGMFDNEVAFGQTQYPSLNDYADGVDTVEFLLKTSLN